MSQLDCVNSGNKLQRKKRALGTQEIESRVTRLEGRERGGGGGEERHRYTSKGEGPWGPSTLGLLSGFQRWGFQGRIQGRTSIEYPSAFQVSWSLLIGLHQGTWSLVPAAGPDVSHDITQSGFATFLGLKLKHNRGLDIISSWTISVQQIQGFVLKSI